MNKKIQIEYHIDGDADIGWFWSCRGIGWRVSDKIILSKIVSLLPKNTYHCVGKRMVWTEFQTLLY